MSASGGLPPEIGSKGANHFFGLYRPNADAYDYSMLKEVFLVHIT